ncbi:MAG: ATP-binding protein [Gammaproteobacteria bacterium]|nr:ATP-binding protein [Gammaproteobacteria bacterium]
MLTVRNLKRLTVVYLLVAVPIVAWATFVLSRDRLFDDFARDVRAQLDLFASGLRGEIEKYAFLPRVLARDSAIITLLQNANDSEQVMVVNRKLDHVNEVSRAGDTYLMDRDGTTVAASNWNQIPTFVGQNFAFRPYFRTAMEGHAGRYFALGTTSLRRGYYFSYPVYGDAAKIIGVSVVKVSMDKLEQAWREYDLTLLVTDEQGVVFSTNKPDWQFFSLTRLTDAAVAKIRANQQYPLSRIEPLLFEPVAQAAMGDVIRVVREAAPTEYFRIVRPLPDLGWTIHALGDLTPLQRSLYYRIGAAVLVSLMIWALVIAAALRRISLSEQLAFRQRTEQQLIEARDKLEQRVAERTHALTLSNQELQQEIVERRRAEKELRQAQDELIHAAKLATLGQLSAGVTHELNQPLAAISAYADNAITLLDRDARPEANENLKEILRLSDRMSQIMAHLKTYSRKTDDAIEAVNLEVCINDALSLVSARLRTLDVISDLKLSNGTRVSGNAVRLEQVFVNLFTNALDAMQDSPEPRLTVRQTNTNGTLVTEVIDTGPGIDPKYIDQVFDPFFTTKDVGVGLGLGLSIAHGIVQKFGGQLTVRNQPQGGACFLVTLPRIG